MLRYLSSLDQGGDSVDARGGAGYCPPSPIGGGAGRRRAKLIVVVALVLSWTSLAPNVGAQSGGSATSPTRAAEDQEIYARLGAISPEAVPIFQGATAANDARDFRAAEQGFEQVLELAPD